VGDPAQPRVRGQYLVVDPLGEQRQEHVRLLRAGNQPSPRQGTLVVVLADRVRSTCTVQHLQAGAWNPARDENVAHSCSSMRFMLAKKFSLRAADSSTERTTWAPCRSHTSSGISAR